MLVDNGWSTNKASSCEMLQQITGNNSETMYRTDLRFEEVVYLFVFTAFQVLGFFY